MKNIGIYDSSLRLEETLIPSPHSLDLEHSIEGDYFQRFSNQHTNVAELYHVNSKLVASSPLTLPPDRTELAKAREWFFTTSYDLREEDFVAEHAHRVRALHSELRPSLGALTSQLAQEASLNVLLHALDVFVLQHRTVYRVLPRRGFVWLERQLDAEAMEGLASAFPAGVEVDLGADRPLVFLSGSFWRFMKFYGVRGYRMVLMEAGQLAREIVARGPAVHHEVFYDDKIDRALMLDGVENSVLAVLQLSEV